jgi:hypothetical protein
MYSKAEEIARAAGLFEGEGTMVVVNASIQLRIKMTDVDVSERLFAVFGVGGIYGPYESGSRDEARAETALALPGTLRPEGLRSHGFVSRKETPCPRA